MLFNQKFKRSFTPLIDTFKLSFRRKSRVECKPRYVAGSALGLFPSVRPKMHKTSNQYGAYLQFKFALALARYEFRTCTDLRFFRGFCVVCLWGKNEVVIERNGSRWVVKNAIGSGRKLSKIITSF